MSEVESAGVQGSHEDTECVDDAVNSHEDALRDKPADSAAADTQGRNALEKELHRDAPPTSPLLPLPRVVD